MRILTNSGYVDAVCLFFELTDEQLEEVKNNPNYYLDKSIFNRLKAANGDNVHFCGVCNNGEASLITKHLTMLLKDYKTVSWWDKDMNEFKLKRR